MQNPSYYLSAADAESLKNIFQQISDQIETGGSSTTLSSEAVVKDIISQQFCLPAGTTAEQIRCRPMPVPARLVIRISGARPTMGIRAQLPASGRMDRSA